MYFFHVIIFMFYYIKYLIFNTNDVLWFVLDIFVTLSARRFSRMINTGQERGEG